MWVPRAPRRPETRSATADRKTMLMVPAKIRPMRVHVLLEVPKRRRSSTPSSSPPLFAARMDRLRAGAIDSYEPLALQLPLRLVLRLVFGVAELF